MARLRKRLPQALSRNPSSLALAHDVGAPPVPPQPEPGRMLLRPQPPTRKSIWSLVFSRIGSKGNFAAFAKERLVARNISAQRSNPRESGRRAGLLRSAAPPGRDRVRDPGSMAVKRFGHKITAALRRKAAELMTAIGATPFADCSMWLPYGA
jgi:hypothetical protein